MEQIRQADLARELGVSDMTVLRLRRAMHLQDRAITDHACTMIFAAFELQKIGVTVFRSTDLISRFSEEVRYAAADTARRAWLVFIETDKHDAILAAISARHLESLIDCFPLSIVLPLHECVARSSERLSALKERLAREVAA